MLNKLTVLCFSPTGGTAKAAGFTASALAESVETVDLLRPVTPRAFTAEDTVLIAMPVFGGRIPAYALEQLRPDYFIAVDACHGRTLGCHEYDRVHDLGCGAVISFGMNSRPAFAGELALIAQMERVPFDREAMPGKSFTDAWAAQITHEGVCTAVVSYPLRHMHTPVEVLDLGDAEAVVHLLAAVCAHFGGAE